MCLSVKHYLVLAPSQTQRCQYCLHNVPSSQGLILYFTVEEKKKLPASNRVMFPSHTNSSLSCCAIYLSHSHEACHQGPEHSSLGGQAYIDLFLVIHHHLGLKEDYGMARTVWSKDSKRAQLISHRLNISLLTLQSVL